MTEVATDPGELELEFTVQKQKYSIAPFKITFREMLEAGNLEGVKAFELNLIDDDSMVRLALAYLAIKRREPGVEWSSMLDLAPMDVQMRVLGPSDPLAKPSVKGSGAKRPSRKSSAADSSTPETSGNPE